MLQELGVLAERDIDQLFSINRLLAKFDPVMMELITPYYHWMEQSGRAQQTILHHLRHLELFSVWLKSTYPAINVQSASFEIIARFFEHLSSRYRHSAVTASHDALRRFYQWLKYRGKIIHVPITDFDIPRLNPKLTIMSSEDLKSITEYIKDRKSPAESALMLALALFFGLTTEDLANATCDTSNTLVIHLRRRPRSYGRHFYNRDQSLVLPRTPAWLLELTNRFIAEWRMTYPKVKQTYAAPRLLLPRNAVYSRPLHQKTVLERFYQATIEATGKRIPVKVFRQTCGHLHSRNGDSSLLATLGWSPSFSFYYTWLPRQIFSAPNTTDKRIK